MEKFLTLLAQKSQDNFFSRNSTRPYFNIDGNLTSSKTSENLFGNAQMDNQTNQTDK